MNIGFMKDVPLSYAINTFLLDCQIIGLDRQARGYYHDTLAVFIHFTGDILVKELTPDHVRMYIAYLADHHGKEERHTRLLAKQYGAIRTWIRWLFAQKTVAERFSNLVKPPPLKSLFPLRLKMA